MSPLLTAHKHYGSLLLVLILAVIIVALTKGPKTVLQRIVTVLVDINLVVGLVAFFQTARPISWFHPILALAAVAFLHIGAKSEDKSKVVRCFSIALLLLIAAWAVNASWGPEWFKLNFVKLPAAAVIAK
jgi:heme/copper-type cytochrome/quinol oxidase subunit 4